MVSSLLSQQGDRRTLGEFPRKALLENGTAGGEIGSQEDGCVGKEENASAVEKDLGLLLFPVMDLCGMDVGRSAVWWYCWMPWQLTRVKGRGKKA
jgi:hypothetical protein